MQLLFVRHGRPQHEILTEGIADPGLCPIGQWQAECLTAWLRHEPIDAIVSSPKRRAQETVAGLAAEFGLPISVVDDLQEIDRAASVYMPTELLATEGGEYWEAVKRQEWDAIGWDSPEVFGRRVNAAFAQLVADPPGEHVVVGCHGGVIQFILNGMLGSNGVRLQSDYASITRVDVAADGRHAVLSLNETGHFDARRDTVTGPMRDGNHTSRRH